ncbi:MAG: cell division protein FtsA [Aestuariivita sp.]|nr:cell division protein FtsA [Aestuariivita sp.]
MRDLIDAQRAMRQLRMQALQRGVLAILDVGTSKIACLVLQFERVGMSGEGSEFNSLQGHADFRVIGASTIASRGIERGEITGMYDAEYAIRSALQQAQKMAGTRVDHVIASFSGGSQNSFGLSGSVEIEGQAVSEYDIARVLASCNLPADTELQEVLHAQPVNFMLDHRSGLRDPRGQIGHTLSADMHMLTVDPRRVQNLIQCINRCDLEVAGLASSAYVAGLSSLVEDELELGSACIDLGGGTTGLSIFMKKHMIYVDCVGIGGDNITDDISAGFGISTAKAERIKAVHGGVHAVTSDDRETIDLTGSEGEWDYERRSASRSELIGIMRPRVEEILEHVRAKLDAAGFEHLPSKQIVLTGGGSQTPGLDLLAGRILRQQVRLGRPLRIHGLPQAVTGPNFSAVVGLSLFAACPQDEWWDFNVPADRYPRRSLKRAVRWFRDNW